MTYVFTLGQIDDEESAKTENAKGVDYVGFLGSELGAQTTAGSAIDLFKTLTGAIAGTGLAILEQSETKVIFRSNVTPEIIIDVPSLLKGEQAAKVQPAVSTESNELIMKLIAPQISFRAKNLGFIKTTAPYGSPTPNAWIMFLVIIAASGLIGAKMAWTICAKIPPK